MSKSCDEMWPYKKCCAEVASTSVGGFPPSKCSTTVHWYIVSVSERISKKRH